MFTEDMTTSDLREISQRVGMNSCHMQTLQFEAKVSIRGHFQ